MEHLIKLRTIFLSEVPQILKSFTVGFLLLIIYKIIWSFEEERIRRGGERQTDVVIDMGTTVCFLII